MYKYVFFEFCFPDVVATRPRQLTHTVVKSLLEVQVYWLGSLTSYICNIIKKIHQINNNTTHTQRLWYLSIHLKKIITHTQRLWYYTIINHVHSLCYWILRQRLQNMVPEVYIRQKAVTGARPDVAALAVVFPLSHRCKTRFSILIMAFWLLSWSLLCVSLPAFETSTTLITRYTIYSLKEASTQMIWNIDLPKLDHWYDWPMSPNQQNSCDTS